MEPAALVQHSNPPRAETTDYRVSEVVPPFSATESDAPTESRTRPTTSRTRPRSIRVARATRRERARAEESARRLELTLDRPRTRSECVNGPRPCPFVGCRHHLYLEVSPTTGTIKLNFPDLEVWELAETCALDLAEAEPLSLERTSDLLNLTRERIRQIESAALLRLGALEEAQTLR